MALAPWQAADLAPRGGPRAELSVRLHTPAGVRGAWKGRVPFAELRALGAAGRSRTCCALHLASPTARNSSGVAPVGVAAQPLTDWPWVLNSLRLRPLLNNMGPSQPLHRLPLAVSALVFAKLLEVSLACHQGHG